MSEYDSHRRRPGKHRRVTKQGTELFDYDGVKQEPSDMRADEQRNEDDDERILGELPPHWAVFTQHR